MVNELRQASSIIWDEVVMCLLYCIEAVGRTLRKIMKSPNFTFEGKSVLFSGGFRQILPVAPRGSRGMIVFMCFKSSLLHQSVKCLSLTQNMRLRAIRNDVDTDKSVLQYPNFLLKLGEVKLKTTRDSSIDLPTSVNTCSSETQ